MLELCNQQRRANGKPDLPLNKTLCANAAVNSGFISTYAIFTRDIISFAKDEELELGLRTGRVLKGDTLEELAEKMNEYAIKGQYPQVSADVVDARRP